MKLLQVFGGKAYNLHVYSAHHVERGTKYHPTRRDRFKLKTWREAEILLTTKGQVAWRRRIDGPILHEGRRET